MIDIRVQAADFDPGAQAERLRTLGLAAIASFTGHVAGPDVVEAQVEHHAVLAREELGRIAREAAERWRLGGVILLHRFGGLGAGERLLFVGVAADDPEAAHAACAWATEALRTRAPFWRKDRLAGGDSRWLRPLDGAG